MVTLNYLIQGSNGDTIRLDGSSDYFLTSGFRGVGIPPTDVRISNSAGDGGTWRSTRRGVRDLDLPITVVGTDRADVESKLRRLASALSDRYGTPKLVGEYSDGSSYEIEIHYTGGAETQFGSDAGATYARWAITLQAPDPFWTSRNAVNFSVSASTGTKGLLPELDRLLVQSSQVLGQFVIENAGDVDAFPVWTFAGPSTNVAITLNDVGFTYTETLIAGNTITIDTKTARVTNSAGTNKYAYLGTAPKLFSFPPGQSTISITMTGADANSRVSGYYLPRREVLH